MLLFVCRVLETREFKEEKPWTQDFEQDPFEDFNEGKSQSIFPLDHIEPSFITMLRSSRFPQINCMKYYLMEYLNYWSSYDLL